MSRSLKKAPYVEEKLFNRVCEMNAKNEKKVLKTWSRASTIFPSFVTDSLRYGFRSFGQKISGFDAPDTMLTAAETRTSAPVRILRNRETMTAVGHPLIYPCGEGAGYAGGITSAAVDGLRAAMALMSTFAPTKNNQ